MGGGPDWFAVGEDRLLLPPERDTTERCEQWLAVLATFDGGLLHLRGPCGVSIVAPYLRAIFETDEPY